MAILQTAEVNINSLSACISIRNRIAQGWPLSLEEEALLRRAHRLQIRLRWPDSLRFTDLLWSSDPKAARRVPRAGQNGQEPALSVQARCSSARTVKL
jgi:hypothetical protein